MDPIPGASQKIEWIQRHFGSDRFPDWPAVVDYLKERA
jgi:hypothetical protein